MNQITVFGATGRQGSAVAKLLSQTHLVKSVTRSHSKPIFGKRVIIENLQDKEQVAEALAGSQVVFIVHAEEQTPSGFDAELKNVETIFQCCEEQAEIKHVIYSSSIGIESKPLQSQMLVKKRLEESLKSKKHVNYTILRPVYFMSNFNFLIKDMIETKLFAIEYPPDFPVDVIAEEDIAKIVHKIACNVKWYGKTLEIASDRIEFGVAAKLISEKIGQELQYHEKQLPFELDLNDLNLVENGAKQVLGNGTMQFSDWVQKELKY